MAGPTGFCSASNSWILIVEYLSPHSPVYFFSIAVFARPFRVCCLCIAKLFCAESSPPHHTTTTPTLALNASRQLHFAVTFMTFTHWPSSLLSIVFATADLTCCRVLQALVYQDGNLVAGSLDALIHHLVPTTKYHPDVSICFRRIFSIRKARIRGSKQTDRGILTCGSAKTHLL